jgi:hypothetical protein
MLILKIKLIKYFVSNLHTYFIKSANIKNQLNSELSRNLYIHNLFKEFEVYL